MGVGCEQEEEKWMNKLRDAQHKWEEMNERDKEVDKAYEEATDVLKEIWGEVGILWANGEGALGGELGLWTTVTRGFDAERKLQELAKEQRETNQEYQEDLDESDELLDELCECLDKPMVVSTPEPPGG
jgi:hypothetical protein